MSLLPLLEPDRALFLDFDGTLADLAPRPELVQVEAELVGTLRALHAALDGALAIVSGRPVAELDHFLQPLVLPAAGIHGAEMRNGSTHGEVVQVVQASLGPVLPPLEALGRSFPALQIEHKSVAVAVHYRLAPELENLVRHTVEEAVRPVRGLEVLMGKMVVEVKPAGINKGTAVDAFMALAPFAGRVPLFAGDDVTDEPGFVRAQDLGGTAVLVGQRASAAKLSVEGPDALRAWLHRSAAMLARHRTPPAAPAPDAHRTITPTIPAKNETGGKP